MKVIRVICNIIIGIILFGLIFTFLFSSSLKKFIEKDTLKETIKTTIDELSKNDMKLTESQKQVIDDMFKDSEASSIISMILDNYKEYKKNVNYSVSHKDAKKLFDFVSKYRSHIKDLSGEDVSGMTENEFEEYFNENKITEFAINSFKEFDKAFQSGNLDRIFDIYSFATSNAVYVILIFVIILFIGLICLINWNLIKWMLICGIDLIISGSLFTAIYVGGEILKDYLLKEKAKISLDLSRFLISSIVQVSIGIILIIIYVVLKKTFKKKKDSLVLENKEPLESQV